MAAPKVKIARDWMIQAGQMRPKKTSAVSALDLSNVKSVIDLPQWLSPREAAVFLKVHPKTATDMMAKGIVRSVKMRGRRFTTPEWIGEYFTAAIGNHG